MRSANWLARAVCGCAIIGAQGGAVSADLSFLQGLLNATPAGGWVKANTNTFSAAWPTGADLPPPSPSGPEAVAYAWSGFAWDSHRASVLLFGGGHANYAGNEVYAWNGTNGQWTLGSLPSKVERTGAQAGFVIGNDAPQSSHTYQTNIYVPVNDRFVVFGGASWPSGGNLENANGRTGPWWWNPALADPSKVGGGNGTGWDPSREGSNAWQVRPFDPWVGLGRSQGPGYIYGTTATRIEGGKDVVYLTMDQNASGFPSLYRYELGDPGTPDVWARVGTAGLNYLQSGAAMIDSQRGFFVRTALANGPDYQTDLAIWNLSNNNASNPSANRALGIRLVETNGAAWDTSFAASIDYDVVNDQYIIWDGRDKGTVWVTRPEYLANNTLDTEWTVVKMSSTTAVQPVGNHGDGVLGKWEYVEELGAFVAMDSFNFSTGDAAIWLYKPMVSAVPEAAAWQTLLLGGLLIGSIARRRRAG